MDNENNDSKLAKQSLSPISPDTVEKDVKDLPQNKVKEMDNNSGREHGKRLRKNVQFLNQEYNKDLLASKKSIETEAGVGTKIADMEKSVDGLSQVTVGKCPLLKPLHNLMFRRAGKEREIKNNIMNFNGFSYVRKYEGNEAMLTKERASVEIRVNNQSVDGIKSMMDIIGIDRSSNSFEGGKVDKTNLIDRFVDFLEKPDPSFLVSGQNKLVPKRKTLKVKVSSTQTKTSKKSSKKLTEMEEEKKVTKKRPEQKKTSTSKIAKTAIKVKTSKIKKTAFGSASANMLSKNKETKNKISSHNDSKNKQEKKKVTKKEETQMEVEDVEEEPESEVEKEEANMITEEIGQESHESGSLEYESIDLTKLENDIQGIIEALKKENEDITMRLIYSGLGDIYGKSEDEIKARKTEIKKIVAEKI